MSVWVRCEPLVVPGGGHDGPGEAFVAQWWRELPDGMFGVVTRTFRPTATVGMACDSDYVVCRDLRRADDTLVWSNCAGVVWSDRTDVESVRLAAEVAGPPDDAEWAEAVAGAEVAR